LAAQLEATLYFVAAEAITNAVKHSRAGSISVRMERRNHTVSFEVSDDGQGGADLLAGTGLRGLSDRVAAVGGHLEVGSANGHGTRIYGEIPCE
jgi:signal transduction histidine kinase